MFFNEALFFSHILMVIASLLLALRLGKGGLMALIVLQSVLANIFVVKQIELFGLIVTCSDVFAVGVGLSLNLLQEYFGKEAAKKAVLISFFALIFFSAMSWMHLSYLPAQGDWTQEAFETIFSSSIRIVSASMVTFYLVQRFDIRFFSLLKGPLPFKMALSAIVSQGLDTILFSFLGLYGLVDALFHVMMISFVIKCLIAFFGASFALFSKKVVKNVPL